MSDLRRRDFDVIHNNSLHYLPVAMADTLDAPMVTTLHTPPFCWLESGVRLCRGRGGAFIAVSESIRRSWSPITAIDDVVLNGIDLRRFAYWAEPDPEPYLIWSGRIVPEKGLHLAIDAARLVGRTAPHRRTGARHRIFCIRDRAPFGPGRHPSWSSAPCGARPSHRRSPRLRLHAPVEEPYGLVIAEALACGVPGRGVRARGDPEIVDATCGALAVPDDVVSLAEAIAKALTLPRPACRARAEANCDAEAMISGYERLYETLICRRMMPLAANDVIAVPSPAPELAS